MNTSPSTIRELIEHNATLTPQAVYAVSTENDQQINFGDLLRSSRAVEDQLRSLGARSGDTISVVMPNGLQTLRILLGALYSGLRVNPVNLLAQPEQMRYVLGHCDCKMVCVAPQWEERVRAVLAGLDRPVAVIVVDPDAPEGFAASDATDKRPSHGSTEVPEGSSPALLMYTSGTTGVPKGVVLTQSNLVANAQAIASEHALTSADRVLAVLPLYHINAFVVTMLAPLASGGSMAITPKFSAARFWDQVIRKQCTWINVVPTIVSYLLEGAAPRREALARIRFGRSASAALPPEHLQAFEDKFGIGIIETMGLTETAAPAFSNPLEREQRKLGSVGRPSGCEAKVVDTELREVPDGQSGELIIRGPNIMPGYYKNEEATQASFTPDGWLRTGDLGHRDHDGFFFVTGRIKELIIKGGENIAPREIDEALLGHPAVLEAASVGIPDRHYGQEIMVCIVLREGMRCEEDELRAFCVEHLGAYKTPKLLRFVTELPRGPSGKVQRLKLLSLLE